MAQHNELGKQGEKVASKYLEDNGYCVIEKNWRYGHLEIDIIALHKEYIVFVEVKTRKSRLWENPEDSVSNAKIRRIVEAADHYLKHNEIDRPARFDIIALIWDGEHYHIDHFDDAFLPPVN